MLSSEFLSPTQLAKPKSAHSIQAGQGNTGDGQVGDSEFKRLSVGLVGSGWGALSVCYKDGSEGKLGRASCGCRPVRLDMGEGVDFRLSGRARGQEPVWDRKLEVGVREETELRKPCGLTCQL